MELCGIIALIKPLFHYIYKTPLYLQNFVIFTKLRYIYKILVAGRATLHIFGTYALNINIHTQLFICLFNKFFFF